MPIYVNKADTLSSDDIEDLKKIYADYPVKAAHDRLENAFTGTPPANWTLVHARFNDRLLGALWIHQDGEKHVIHDMCVRNITRGRGVGRRLIEVCKDMHADIQAGEIPPEISDSQAIVALIEKYSD